MHVLYRLRQAQLGSIQKPLLKHQRLLQEFLHFKYSGLKNAQLDIVKGYFGG